jgi:hypothetical protein
MKPERCDQCEDYQAQEHNYCRMCGFHLTKVYVQYVRLAVTYNTQEKFCGYCGGAKQGDWSRSWASGGVPVPPAPSGAGAQ